MKILITGGSGRLGKELKKAFTGALSPSRSELNITDMKNVEEYIDRHKPDALFHLAAVTNIPECENNQERAWKVNVEGTKNLLDVCSKLNKDCYFVYISTAAVFEGKKGSYTESDIPAPGSYYGLTKLVAETAVGSSCLKNRLIIRANFVPREKWPHKGAFTDRYGTYLFADDLAYAIKEVFEAGKTGVVHIAGDRKLSMYELAKITTPEVAQISWKQLEKTTDYKLMIDMSLDSTRWKKYRLGYRNGA